MSTDSSVDWYTDSDEELPIWSMSGTKGKGLNQKGRNIERVPYPAAGGLTDHLSNLVICQLSTEEQKRLMESLLRDGGVFQHIPEGLYLLEPVDIDALARNLLWLIRQVCFNVMSCDLCEIILLSKSLFSRFSENII